jgi:hypothetical protein
MHRGVLIQCLPWLALVIVLFAALGWLVALSCARLQLTRLRQLHRDQAGSVQSLSFVLTLPVFFMLLMMIVQATQLMIAQVVVEYAAIAAARAAMVWVPAILATGGNEGENRISSYSVNSDQSNSEGGTRYLVSPSSPKFEKIRSAAVLACLPIAPSRSVGTGGGQGNVSSGPPLSSVQAAYQAVAPQSTSNSMIATRIANKLAYSLANTQLQLTFVHKSGEPPLATWYVGPDLGEFYSNEIGWQDELQVKVTHALALLPGPGRLLFSKASSSSGATDQVSSQIQQQQNNLYTYSLTASASLGNEGEKSVLSYVYQQ